MEVDVQSAKFDSDATKASEDDVTMKTVITRLSKQQKKVLYYLYS